MKQTIDREVFLRSCAVAALLTFVAICPVAADEDQAHLAPEDVLNVTWAIRPKMAPDGLRLLYAVVETRDGRRQTSFVLREVKENGESITILQDFSGVGSVEWSPDGKLLAFVGKDKNKGEGRQLYLARGDATEPRRLTNMPNGVSGFRWASDSMSLAFTADERKRRERRSIVNGGDAPRNALWTISIDGIEAEKVTPDNRHVIDFAWSPGGQEFAVLAATSTGENVASQPVVLEIVRRSDGKPVRVLTENATTGCNVTWSPDGTRITAAVFAPRRISRRFAVFRADGGKPEYPFKDYHATPMEHVEWTSDSRDLFVQFTENTQNQLIRYNTSSGESQRLTEELTNFWDYDVDRDGSTIVVSAESQHDPPDIFIKANRETRRLTDYNTHLRNFRLGQVKTVQWKSSIDDRTIYGVLITPPDFRPNEPCPTIVNLHSGPHWFWWEGWIGTYLSWGQFLASNGYAVFMPNHRGSIGQGWEFAEAHYREWGRGDYQDVMDGVDMLVEGGIADPDRLGVGGGSFGGYLAAWVVTQSDRFRAGIVDAGWTDLVSSNLSVDVPEPLRVYMGGTELELGDLYRSRSPLTFVGQCRTPTLVLHGENDRRVPTDQGRMFYRALQLCGVETELVIYRNEGHGLAKRQNQLDSLRRVKDWFDRHLGGE